MLKRVMLIAAVLTMLLLVFGSVTAQDTTVTVGPVTQAILDRGTLRCGVHPGLAGFGFVNDAGEYEGFDVAFCRAVAAAVLGDASAVEFTPLDAAQRQAAIQSGDVDMMSRNTTWTLSRDSSWNASFGPVTFYDGQGLMVLTESGIATIEDLEGASVCVETGTTTELNLADAFNSRGLSYEPQVFNDNASTVAAYVEGRCDALTTDKSGLAAIRASQADPGAHTILEITLSKEPLAPLTPQNDPQFADIVTWVVYGMIQAEESGITSQNIDEFLTSEDPTIQRLLGQGENQIGSLYGIPNDFMVAVIRQVGNYGEVYERYLGPETALGLERGLNALWTDGGLMYSPPFR